MAADRKAIAASLRRHRARLAARMHGLQHMLRGTLVERYKKCGKPGCHCAQGRGHGPAWYLSVTLEPGRTRSYYVAAAQKKLVARYLRNYQELRKLAEQITAINRRLLERGALDEGS